MPEEASQSQEEAVAVEAHDQPEGPKGMAKMGKEKERIAGPISILSFMVSLPVLGAVVWLLYMKNYDCEELLRLPKVQVGVGISLTVVFLLSNAVVYLRERAPFPGLVAIMVPLMVLLTMGLSLVGACSMESKAVPASPIWLDVNIQNEDNWGTIKSCIYDTSVCHHLQLQTNSPPLKSYNFITNKLSPIQSGCCQPPKSCNMDSVNATFWVKRRETENLNNDDCETWKNDENELCYNCEACKEGYTKILQSKWRKLGMFLIFMSLLLMICHLLLFLTTMWERYKS